MVDDIPPLRVLIVDDDPRVRAALRAYLSAVPDIDVIGAADSPAAALDIARRAAPTVAVIDLLIPDAQDGLTLLRTLTGMRIPTVALSIEHGLWASALAAGACQFVGKGSSPDLLLAALRAAGR